MANLSGAELMELLWEETVPVIKPEYRQGLARTWVELAAKRGIDLMGTRIGVIAGQINDEVLGTMWAWEFNRS
jgi:hypothetical protein